MDRNGHETQEVVYSWKPGARIPVPAAVAAHELKRLEGEDGAIRPEDVVEIARAEAAPLHPAFEWDDGVAAERFRRVQAQHLIRSLVVRTVRVERPVRAYVNLTVPLSDGAGDAPELAEDEDAGSRRSQVRYVYLPIQRVQRERELRDQLVVQAEKELGYWVDRFIQYAELAGAVSAVRDTWGKVVVDLRAAREARQAAAARAAEKKEPAGSGAAG